MPAEPIDLILDAITKSTGAIAPIYFQLPVAGAEDPQFRERVYCYELYHQLRSRWPDIPHRITGEIDKINHPYIHGNGLDYAKPDFTIHIPRTMEHNLLVIEVKARNPTDKQVIIDLRKLTSFCRHAKYSFAYYLLYGLDEDEAKAFAEDCRRLAAGKEDYDLNLITLFNHAEPGVAAVPVAWPAGE